jgi:hypothetical protein
VRVQNLQRTYLISTLNMLYRRLHAVLGNHRTGWSALQLKIAATKECQESQESHVYLEIILQFHHGKLKIALMSW